MKQKIKEQYPQYSSKEDCKQMQDTLESYLKMQKEKNKNLSKTNMQDSEDFLYPLPYKAYESESEK